MIDSYIKAILDNSPECIVLIDKNHEVLAFNATIKDVLFEYHKREIKVGDLYYPDFVIEASKTLYLKAFESAMNGIPFVVHDLTKNENTSYWFEYRMVPVYNEKTLIGVTLSAKNITKEKLAELQVITISDHLKAILNNTDESITLLDLDYRIITMNQIAVQTSLYNTNIEAVIGKDFREFIPDKENLFYKYYPKATKGESSSVEISYINASGDEIWYQTKFNPVYNQARELYGVSIFAKDITEKKKLENSLIESEERFRKIANSAPVGILISDKNLKITYANFYSVKLFKYTSEDFSNLYLTDFIENFNYEEQHSGRVDKLSSDHETLLLNSDHFVGTSKDKNRLELLLSAVFFKNKKEDNIIFIVQDITERISKDNTIAMQHNKLKEIAWHQSHIIRAPLARLMGIVAFLQNDNLEDAEKNYLFDSFVKSAHELDTVIKSIVTKTE